MKTHFQAVQMILCALILGGAVSARATLNPPNSNMETVPSGSFIMGANDTDITDASKHTVFVDTFLMDENLIAYDNWKLVYQWTLDNPSYGYSISSNAAEFAGSSDEPVQTVSWYDAVKWCNARSQMEGLEPCYYTDTADTGWASVYTSGSVNLTTNNVKWDATGYRLPTEAEWEKAARGGLTTNRFPWGMTIGGLTAAKRQACYQSPMVLNVTYDKGPANTTPVATKPVGSFPPNGYQLNDMAGNLNEWCWDAYSSAYYTSGANTNPRGPGSGSTHVIRGGEYNSYASLCRCAARQKAGATTANTFIGFRCVRADNGQAKSTPGVSTLSASSITYGQTLSSSILAGTFTNAAGQNVAGSLAFASPNNVLNAGIQSVQVNFTPADSTTYNPATASVSVTVNPATPVPTTPSATPINTNQTLADSVLSGSAINPYNNAAVAGTFAFTTPWPTLVLGVNPGVSVTFTPTDANNYTTATTNTIVVVQAVAVQQTNIFVKLKPTATVIGYGQTLANSTLIGGQCTNAAGAIVGGAFAFVVSDLLPAAAGITNVQVVFTPTDSNYKTVGTTVPVTVARAIPQLSILPSSINYGQILTNSSLAGSTALNTNNNAAVQGTFAFATPSAVPNAGTPAVNVKFTPQNTANYAAVTNSVNVTVVKATPVLTVAATAIKYGQVLTNASLSASRATNTFNKASVPGTFAFATPTFQPNAGTANVSVIFTPTNTANYNPVTANVNVVVGRASPVLTPPVATAITSGQTLANSSLVGGAATNAFNKAPVTGNFTFTTPAIKPNVGTTNVSVTFVPNDTANYSNATTRVNVTVGRASTNKVALLITANDATWDMNSSYPVFTVRCSGLIPGDYTGDTNNLVGANTVFGTNLYVWSPAAYNALPDGTYTNFIIPSLVGVTNSNYIVSYKWGNLTIVNSTLTPGAKAATSNGVVTPDSLAGFLGAYNVDQAGLNAVLARYWSQSPPCITNTTFPGRTNLCFTITNFSFTVQYSTNLSTWKDLGGPACISFTDTNAVIRPNVYYRLVGSTNN